MRIILLSFALNFLFLLSINAQNKWLGGVGDWDDPSEWSLGTVPTVNDDVLISVGIVNIPANGDYYANNIEVFQSPEINFLGDFNAGEMHIYGNVHIEQDVTLVYQSNSTARWTFEGTNTNHEIYTEGNDLNGIYLDEQSSQIELMENIKATSSFRIKNGALDTNNNDIDTGTFIAGGGCNGPNCLPKTLSLGNSDITCSDKWRATFNYGSLTLQGNYHIASKIFEGGNGVVYNNVTLTDFEATSLSGFQDLQLLSRNNTFNNLTIDNMYDPKLAGDLTVNGIFKVVNQSTRIHITKEANSSTTQWSFNGTVDLVEDLGGCLDFTYFEKKSGIDDNFNFHTNNSNLVFDWAILENIPTSGGGTFTVSKGYAIGNNGDWNITQPLISKTLYWIGNNGNWNDGSKWSTSSGGSPYGCPPSIVDNVVFDQNSFTSSTQNITINNTEYNFCKNFSWKSMNISPQVVETSAINLNPKLYISGEVDIEMPNIFDADDLELHMVANDEHGFSSVSPLPRCYFISSTNAYLQNSDLIFDKGVDFIAGYYATEGFDIQVNGSLICSSNEYKQFHLYDSQITATNNVKFGDLYGNGNVNMNAGTSHIICDQFSSGTNDFNIVETNSPLTYFINPDGDNIYIRKFVMNGGTVKILESGLDVDSLVFNSNSAELKLQNNTTSNVYKHVVSNITSGNAPKISREIWYNSTQSKINFSEINSCITGMIEISDIEAISSSPVNIPEGIDGGGNINFDFTPIPSYTGILYWIGGDGELTESINWSTKSGGCSTSINPSIADQLIFDEASFLGPEDTVRISTITFVNKVKWDNAGSGINNNVNLFLNNTLYVEEWDVDSTAVYLASPSNRTISIDHHLHMDNGYMNIKNMTIIIGNQPSTLSESTFSMENSSILVAADLRIFLRGQANDLNLPTFKVSSDSYYLPSTNPNSFSSELWIYPPLSGQPIRDFKIEGNNSQFDLINVVLPPSTPQKVLFNDDIKCDKFVLNNGQGEVRVTSGSTLQIND